MSYKKILWVTILALLSTPSDAVVVPAFVYNTTDQGYVEITAVTDAKLMPKRIRPMARYGEFLRAVHYYRKRNDLPAALDAAVYYLLATKNDYKYTIRLSQHGKNGSFILAICYPLDDANYLRCTSLFNDNPDEIKRINQLLAESLKKLSSSEFLWTDKSINQPSIRT